MSAALATDKDKQAILPSERTAPTSKARAAPMTDIEKSPNPIFYPHRL
jgi:hypothetical protein